MNIGKFFMKNMYIILSILAIIIFFYFISYFPLGFVEGFVEDEYKYLAPPSWDNSWSQDTITQFIEKYNNNNPGGTPMAEKDVNFFIKNPGVTEEEAKYYIQNGNWPYDAYVLNYVKQNPDIMKNWTQTDSGPILSSAPTGSLATLSYLSKYWPNRLFYQMLINPIEFKQNPQPLSYQIFAGLVPDPNASQTDTSETDTSQTVSPITSSSLTSSSTNLSDSDYNTLFGLCKNIMLSN